jgi:hypothetical protein
MKKGCGCKKKIEKSLQGTGWKLPFIVTFDEKKKLIVSGSPYCVKLERDGTGRKKALTLYATYCPFCGVKIP